MPTYIALLRGINVANKQIQMVSLREICTGLGAEAPRTYIQSGNVVFEHGDSPVQLREAFQVALEHTLGLRVEVIIRTTQELAAVAANNPFLRRGALPEHLHVTFLDKTSLASSITATEELSFGVDEFEVDDKEVYVHCPAGYGRTKLNNAFFEKRLLAIATTRNWRTVIKLCELAAE